MSTLPPSKAKPPVVLACGSILCRLDLLERALGALVAVLPHEAAESIRLGIHFEEDRAIIALRPRPREPMDLGRIAIRAARLPGLCKLDPRGVKCPPGVTPADQALLDCDTVIPVRTAAEAMAQVRASLGMSFDPRKQMRLAIPIDVRFRGPLGISEGTTENLSVSGTYVRSVKPAPGLGETVPIAFRFEGGMVRASATVVHVASDADGGFGARLSLDPRSEEELARQILAVARQRAPESRQAPQRAPAQLQMTLSSSRQVARELAENLSQGRLFVPTPKAPPLESKVEVLLRLPDGQQVGLLGRVVRIITRAGAGRGSAGPGCGVSIGPPDESLMSLLRDQIRSTTPIDPPPLPLEELTAEQSGFTDQPTDPGHRPLFTETTGD